MKWLALLLLGGCDSLFNLDPVTLPPDARELDAAIDAVSEACPSVYSPIGTSSYFFVPDVATWEAAEVLCERDTETHITHLVVFDDAAEMQAVRAIVTTPNLSWQVWAGYSRPKLDATKLYYEVTGGTIDAASPLWNVGEPNAGDETATFFQATGGMIDTNAGYFLPSLCECDHKPAHPMI